MQHPDFHAWCVFAHCCVTLCVCVCVCLCVCVCVHVCTCVCDCGWVSLCLRFHTVYNGPAVAHKLQRLSPATKYSLRIAAVSPSGQGAWSDLLTCETLPPGPSAPAELTMWQDGDVIVMSWEEVSYEHPVTFELQLKTGGQDFTPARHV